MRNLINVVLFVLVLFGSFAVPASAQEGSGGMGTMGIILTAVSIIFAILIPLGGLILLLYKWQRDQNKDAHTQIGTNIDKVEEHVVRVESKLDKLIFHFIPHPPESGQDSPRRPRTPAADD